MMRYRKGILILALAIFLLGISGSWASDTNDTVTDTVDKTAIELSNEDIIAADENEDTLKVNEQTFGDLNNTINGNSDRDIYLDNDYKYSDDDAAFKEGIIIDRDLNIYGNGHTINGSNQARIFKINSTNVVFYNITFTNGNTRGNGGAINGACIAVNCTFTGNTAEYGGAIALGSAINCTFTNNTAEYGGAKAQGSAINCTFTNNTAKYYGNAMYQSYYLDCIGQEGDYYNCNLLDLSFEADNFTSTYKSNKGFDIILKGRYDRIDFINVDVVI